MMRPGYLNAVASLRPNNAFQIEDGVITSPDKDFVAPTEKEIQKELKRLQKEYDNNEYQRKRKLEYPSIESQLDTIFNHGIDAWKEQIQAVKDKYPKP